MWSGGRMSGLAEMIAVALLGLIPFALASVVVAAWNGRIR